MIIKNLDRNLYEAEFANKDHFTKQVIYFILDCSSALLIDTGYEQEATQLITYLKERHIMIEKVIITHYHDDHFAGLKALKGIKHEIEILGSSKYMQTLEREYKDDYLLEPDIFPTTFCENYLLIFGGHQIRFEEARGHSDCSIHTIIDEKYVHVADNIIFDNNELSLLPLPYASIQDHLKTLRRLKEKPGVLFLGSHFSASLNTSKDMMQEIDARIAYMQLVLQYKGKLNFDQIKEMLPIEFNPRWHKLMLRFYKEQQEECYASE